ncbi:MAG: AIM24 family protein [Planctomycetales bacterium]|nr:AIM24 family protein [Planctomycetales bacterium]
MCKFTEHDGKVIVSLQPQHCLHVRRNVPIHASSRIRQSVITPVPWQATLARIFNNLLFMLRVSTEYANSRVELACPGGKQIVTIELAEGECMAVSLSHLIAFTRTRFRSCANFSLAAFACDRNFSTVVYGPGIVFLQTNGNHRLHTSGAVTTSPHQLVAWDPKLRFQLDHVNDLMDLYLNKARITCQFTPKIRPLLVDSVPKEGSDTSNPLFSFIRSIYLPRFH